MGRITIFTVDNCPHCRRVTSALHERNLPYSEISLTAHPERRKDVLALTSGMSIPQVFFNTRLVGGVKETLLLLEDWDESLNFVSPRDRYENEIGRFPSPSSPRLQLPADPSPQEQQQQQQGYYDIEAERPKSITLPDGKVTSVFGVTEMLKEILPMEDLNYNLTTYKKSFTGSSGVKSIQKNFDISEEEAVAFCEHLHKAKILHHVCGDHDFQNTNKFFYRLQCYQTPHILNSYRIWNDEPTNSKCRTTTELMKALQSMLVRLEMNVMDENGKINYAEVVNSKQFFLFEEAVCELQASDLTYLDNAALLAFRLNLYNLMLKYALIKIGVSTTATATTGHRPAFLGDVKFNVGGALCSFHDWAKLISSETRTAPYANMVCFGLGMNIWPRSSPPIPYFTSDQIEDELSIAAIAFCQDDDNVIIDQKKKEVWILDILRWHLAYFSIMKDKDLPVFLMNFVQGTKRLHLTNMLRNNSKGPKVIFLELMGQDKHVSDLVWTEERQRAYSANEKKLSALKNKFFTSRHH